MYKRNLSTYIYKWLTIYQVFLKKTPSPTTTTSQASSMARAKSQNDTILTGLRWWMWLIILVIVAGIAVLIWITATTLSNQNEIKDHLKDIAYAMKAFRRKLMPHRTSNHTSSQPDDSCMLYCSQLFDCKNKDSMRISSCQLMCDQICTSMCNMSSHVK